MLKLIELGLEHEKVYKNFVDDWGEESIIPWAAGLHGETFMQWLETRKLFKQKETTPKGKVPDTTYFLIDTNDKSGKLLGAINIRFELNDFLREFGGHIGYGVVPSERKKGYASLMLNQALEICKQQNIMEVSLICDESNIGSAKTIEKRGGKLIEKAIHNGNPILKYIIYL